MKHLLGVGMGSIIRFDISKFKEKDFQKLVIDIAKQNNWSYYHNPDSRRSTAGWPDLVLIREPECLFVELKAEKGKLSEIQSVILNKLALCGMETHVWKPRDLQEIHRRLAL